MQWQPIETAPKDGRVFDAWCPEYGGFRVADCKYGHDHWNPAEFGILEFLPDPDERFRSHWVLSERTLTHWMPLPTPPETDNG